MYYFTKTSFNIFFLIIFLTSCSSSVEIPSRKVKVSKNKTITDLFKKCSGDEKQEWDIVRKNFECIHDVIHLTNSFLMTGNSANALKFSSFGMSKFSFDGRIKELFNISRRVFVKTTNGLDKDERVDCTDVVERIHYLKSISPDFKLNTKRCKLSEDSYTIKRLIDLVPPNSRNKEDLKNFRNIQEEVRYKISQNNRDNYRDILFHAVNFWEGLDFYSTNVDIPNSTDRSDSINLNLRMVTRFEPKRNKLCSNIKKVAEINSGNPTQCGYAFDRCFGTVCKGPHYLDNLSIGTKDLRSSKNYMKNFIIKYLVYSLRFKGNESSTVYYYLSPPTEIVFNSYYDSRVDPWFKEYFNVYGKAPQIYAEFYTKAVNNRFNFKDKSYYFKLSKVDLNAMGDATRVELKYEPLETYKLYLLMHDKNLSLKDAATTILKELSSTVKKVK